MKEHETIVTFVRHGKNNFTRRGVPWHPGPNLNKIGKGQAESTAKHLASFPFDRILSSDMNRARQTAEIINKYQKKNKAFENIVFYREFAEHDQVVYRKNPRENLKHQEELLKAEVTVEFFKRILKENKGKKLLVVGHGNMIRSCIGTSLGYSLADCPELNLFNCSLSSLMFSDSTLKGIFYINSIEHYQRLTFRSKFSTVKFISDYSILPKTDVKKNQK